jgi:catechol 2,3-dioxygenase-like lactoylglutathione lyase family enzyme
MDIIYLELPAKDLQAQKKYYSEALGLPVKISAGRLEVQAGKTELVFTQSHLRFEGAYHFAFNIPENQFRDAKDWIDRRVPLLKDVDGRDEFSSESWNSHSVYFKDAAGNVLEFIARHGLKNGVGGYFNSRHVLNVSEIGLPSENVVGFANGLCQVLGISPYKQEPNESFTPIGDEDGLLILPVKDRIWFPNSGVPAKLLPVKVRVDVNGKRWEVRGVPYEIAVATM